MAKRRTFLLAGAALLALGLTHQACEKIGGPGESADSLTTWRPGPFGFRVAGPRQPFSFDHEAHIKAEEMECSDCHRMASKSPYAGLPKLKDCADCHSEPQGKHPDEAKVREYIEEGKEIPWQTVNRMPGHVYFSHRAHVVFAEMQCWDCHGDMRKISRTVTEPDIRHLTMRKCMDCHEQKKAENECSTCHK